MTVSVKEALNRINAAALELALYSGNLLEANPGWIGYQAALQGAHHSIRQIQSGLSALSRAIKRSKKAERAHAAQKEATR